MVYILIIISQYRFYGEPVVKAAVENGCHHLDISGEPEVRLGLFNVLFYTLSIFSMIIVHISVNKYK